MTDSSGPSSTLWKTATHASEIPGLRCLLPLNYTLWKVYIRNLHIFKCLSVEDVILFQLSMDPDLLYFNPPMIWKVKRKLLESH